MAEEPNLSPGLGVLKHAMGRGLPSLAGAMVENEKGRSN